MNYKELIVKSGQRMAGSGLTIDTWGNISALGEDGLMYITPSSMDYSIITEDDICVLDLNCNIIFGTKKPSIESMMHAEIYKARKDIKCIVHTHPIASTAFSCMGEDIPLLIDEAWQSLGDVVKTMPYEKPGTKELAIGAAKALGEKSKACLLQSHGAVCCGATMDEAFKVAKVLEMTSEIYFRIRSMGGNYKTII